jgi:hypothetical protein
VIAGQRMVRLAGVVERSGAVETPRGVNLSTARAPVGRTPT